MKVDKKKIIIEFKNFLKIYKKRPIKKNKGGILLGHAFALYYFLKKINPPYIVESGTFKGQSSWIILQACPKSKIISIDTKPTKISYKNKKIIYLTKDFENNDWSKIPKNSLVFFDDHQNALKRLIYSKWFGFKYVIFEDNDVLQKDFYSIRQVLTNSGFIHNIYSLKKNIFAIFILRLLNFLKIELKKLLFSRFVFFKKIFKNDYGYFEKFITFDIKKNLNDKKILLKNINSYFEFPSLLKKNNNKNFLFRNERDLKNTINEEFIDLEDEISYYNYLCLITLK